MNPNRWLISENWYSPILPLLPTPSKPKPDCPKRRPPNFSGDQFLSVQYGPASAVASQYGVDPTLLLGLSALESGWGSSPMYRNQNDPFGATPGGDATAGLSYPSFSAAWNSWGTMWGPRVNGVGSDVSAFTTALTQNNQGNPNAVDQRGSYNFEDFMWPYKVGSVVNSVRARLPGALAIFGGECP